MFSIGQILNKTYQVCPAIYILLFFLKDELLYSLFVELVGHRILKKQNPFLRRCRNSLVSKGTFGQACQPEFDPRTQMVEGETDLHTRSVSLSLTLTHQERNSP